MAEMSQETKGKIISFIIDGIDNQTIAERFEISARTVSAIKAHITMGSYGPTGIEDVNEALEAKFGLERDLQQALRSNIEELERGLTIIDEGREAIVEAGRIDILAKDSMGTTVVLELKAGKASDNSIAQILSYMATVPISDAGSVRGILVAGEFSTRVRQAAKAIPNLSLIEYGFKFKFSRVG